MKKIELSVITGMLLFQVNNKRINEFLNLFIGTNLKGLK